jgi:hypothetical protein
LNDEMNCVGSFVERLPDFSFSAWMSCCSFWKSALIAADACCPFETSGEPRALMSATSVCVDFCIPLRNEIQLFLSAFRSEVFGLNPDCSFWTSVRKESIAVHTPAAYAVAGMVLADTEAGGEALGVVEGLLGVEFELQAAARNATATRATRRVLCIGGAYLPSGRLDSAVGKVRKRAPAEPFLRSKLRSMDRSRGSA